MGISVFPATPAAGGMTLISTTTLSGATTTLSSIPSTYNDLRIVIRLALPATDSAVLYIRANNDSNASRYNTTFSNSAINGGASAATFSQSEWRPGGATDNVVTNALYNIELLDYANTTTWKMITFVNYFNDPTTTTNFKIANGNGVYNQTDAISSLQLFFNTGDATSGTILLYGVK
jgi:hypothetical protein